MFKNHKIGRIFRKLQEFSHSSELCRVGKVTETTNTIEFLINDSAFFKFKMCYSSPMKYSQNTYAHKYCISYPKIKKSTKILKLKLKILFQTELKLHRMLHLKCVVTFYSHIYQRYFESALI